MKTYVDPPSGWMYGFPKIMPESVAEGKVKFYDWLVSEGYPQKLIDDLGSNFWCRQWFSEEVEDDDA